MDLIGFTLGRRLANRESSQRKIGVFEGVPAVGLNGLSSSAYGLEAALTILMPEAPRSTWKSPRMRQRVRRKDQDSS